MIDMQESANVLEQEHPDEEHPDLVVMEGHLLHLHSFVNRVLGSSPPTFVSTHDFIVY